MNDTDKAREVATTVATHTLGAVPTTIQAHQRPGERTWDVTCWLGDKMTRYVVTHEWVVKPVEDG